MANMPWRSGALADAQVAYLVLLSYLPLRRWRYLPAFLRYLAAIRKQLRGAEGLIGYSLRAQFLRRRFWTLSVWRDERALLDFVQQDPHRLAMGGLQGEMDNTGFLRWHVKGSEIPPSWDEALKRMHGP